MTTFMGMSISPEGKIYIITEKIIGETFTKFMKSSINKVSAEIKKNIALELAQVLYFLHTCHPPIIYRDMKPDNVSPY